jgi:hypothetical protein
MNKAGCRIRRLKESPSHSRFRVLLFLLFLLLPSLPATPGEPPVSVTASLDKKTAALGEPLELTVKLMYDPRVALEEPLIPALLKSLAEAGGEPSSQLFDILEEKKPESLNEKGKKVEVFHYRIAFFRSGKTAFPELAVNFRDLKGRAARARSLPVEIEIKSELGGNGNPKDIRDIKPPLWLNYPWYYYAGGLLALLFLSALIWLLMRLKRRGRTPTGTSLPARPPWETALDEFTALENSGLLAEVRLKEFYVGLADILRKYLEGRYGIPALDRTTQELHQEMKRARVPGEHSSASRELLARCDRVKFARFSPGEEEATEDLREGRRIVRATIPEAPESAAGMEADS